MSYFDLSAENHTMFLPSHNDILYRIWNKIRSVSDFLKFIKLKKEFRKTKKIWVKFGYTRTRPEKFGYTRPDPNLIRVGYGFAKSGSGQIRVDPNPTRPDPF